MKQAGKVGTPSSAGANRPAPAPARPRSVAAITIGCIVLMGVALIALEGWSRYQARQAELGDAVVTTVNVARAAAEHVESSLNLVDAALFDMVEDVEQADIGAAAPLAPAVAARIHRTPGLAGIAIVDGSGGVVLDAGGTAATAQIASAAALAWHRAHPDDQIHLAAPVQQGKGGPWLLPVSRRIAASDGALAGVAIASVRLDAFQRYFSQFDLGGDGVFLLALDHGSLLVRRPYRPELTGSDIRNGPVFKLIGERGSNVTAVRLGLQDQIRRTYSVRRVQSYPLIVAAGVAHHEVLHAWLVGTVTEACVVVLVLAVLARGGQLLLSQLSRRDAAEASMRALQQELERTNRALRDMAMKDGLTGLSNRRELDHQLDAELARASRAGKPLALVMLDVDFFKRYNDHYGHAAGDACLRAVARAIDASGRRPGDTAARFGGEEFAILLPSTDSHGAHAVAQAVCDAVHALNLPHVTSELGIVTVSAGVASLLPLADASCTAAALIEAADAGLYRAKAAGRNQVGSDAALADAAQP